MCATLDGRLLGYRPHHALLVAAAANATASFGCCNEAPSARALSAGLAGSWLGKLCRGSGCLHAMDGG